MELIFSQVMLILSIQLQKMIPLDSSSKMSVVVWVGHTINSLIAYHDSLNTFQNATGIQLNEM